MASPITGGKTRLLRTLTAAEVCGIYQRELGFDVAPYLKAGSIELHECVDTGYQFYAPFDKVEGPPEFYDKLYSTVGKDWGYAEGKWEHDFALNYCKAGDRILDIGCGGGAFLDLARKHVSEVAGLESSKYGQESCRKLGLNVVNETIAHHSAKYPKAYDVVCAFQVLEHVSNVREFIESCIKALKPGGTVVFSVPNNEGFVGGQDLPLNMPPHHVGRWGPRSLQALTRYFGLDLVGLHYEPLGANADWFKSWLERTYFTRNRLLRAIWYRFGYSKSLAAFLSEHAHTIHGHTVLAVYRVR